MQENAAKAGVKTTASGLQYKIIEAGKGKAPGPMAHRTLLFDVELISIGDGKQAASAQ